MKKLLLIFLLFPLSLSAQVPGPGFGFWKESGAAPAFSPADIDSLKGWYVASDLADSLGKSDGDTMYIWPNRAQWVASYTMPDMFQATDALKPTYGDSLGGGVVFDGSDDEILYSAGANYVLAQPGTWFVVGNVHRPLYGSNAFFVDSEFPNEQAILIVSTDDNLDIYSGAFLTTGAGVTIDSTYLFQAEFNGASSTIRNRNKLIAAGNASTQANRDAAIGRGLDGVVYEAIYYHKILTEDERSSITSYLATKYGITLP